jgi:hypothetical protein
VTIIVAIVTSVVVTIVWRLVERYLSMRYRWTCSVCGVKIKSDSPEAVERFKQEHPHDC